MAVVRSLQHFYEVEGASGIVKERLQKLLRQGYSRKSD